MLLSITSLRSHITALMRCRRRVLFLVRFVHYSASIPRQTRWHLAHAERTTENVRAKQWNQSYPCH